MRIDLSFLPALAAAYMLMFARLGTMLMLLPGLGELTVSRRIRLSIALLLTAVMFPLHRSAYQIDLNSLTSIIMLLAQEMLVGAVLGISVRIAISALQFTGSVVAQQLGLGFITQVDPTQGDQGVIVGNFLVLLGLVLLFATDMHHLVIGALHDSYSLFTPGEIPAIGDAAALATRTLAGAFSVAVQLSAPFLVFGILFNLGLGVLSRLMPTMQVYFVGVPLSIIVGFLILLVVVGAMMTNYLSYLHGVLRDIAPHI